MARSTALVLAACALALVAPSHQQYYFPYYPAAYNQRLFFNGNLLPGFLVRTTTSTTTVTSSVTCSKSTNSVCKDGENPFPNGFVRSLQEILEVEEAIAPSQVPSVEPTAVPEVRDAFYTPGFYYPYGEQVIDASFGPAGGFYPPGAYPGAPPQARLFYTRTVTSTSVSTSTRTLNPNCSKANFFSQCP